MKAMLIERIVSVASSDAPLMSVDPPVPEPGEHEIRNGVSVCGVCHAELDEIEGRLAPPKLPNVPSHQVIGRVDSIGASVTRSIPGDRVGVGRIHASDASLDENLCEGFRATGRDVDGGYAEYMTVGERYAFRRCGVKSTHYAIPGCKVRNA